MDVVSLLSVAVRRWYVVVVGIMLTVAAAATIVGDVSPTYEARGSLLLAGPALRGSPSSTAGTATSAPAVAAALNSPSVRAVVLSGAGDATYTVEAGPDGQLLQVTVHARDVATSVATVGALVDAAAEVLLERQEALQVPADHRRIVRGLSLPDPGSGEHIRRVEDPESGIVEHVADALLIVEDPLQGTDNPYASGSFTSRVLEETMLSPDVRSDVLAGLDATYAVAQRNRDAAPVLYLTATGSDARDVRDLYTRVVDRMSHELERRQSGIGVPPELWVVAEPLAQPAVALESRNVLRPLATIVGLGGIATMTVAVIVDALALRRHGRRRRPGRTRP